MIQNEHQMLSHPTKKRGHFASAFFLLALTVLASMVLLASSAGAQVLLKPNGQNAMPLRTKALKADVDIRGQFAGMDMEMTFQNETHERIEADFIYTVPDGAVVTYFAYWFGDEKVVARVVEKQRAAAIYQHITSRMRDPALVEMIGKNTFRARIFPVMPDADLRVQMRYVQTLSSDERGVAYRFPMRPAEEGKGILDSLNVNVNITPDAGLQKVINNYSLPVKMEGGRYHLSLRQSNYRPAQDLQIRLLRSSAALRAALYAAPSGGTDGFFAVALTPNRKIARPVVKISGVKTYSLLFSKLGALAANDELVVCGRYKGSGQALVRVTDATSPQSAALQQYVAFGARREDNNLAAKLWAALRIQVLSANPRNRDAVIQLSTRHTLPSKFTSWLAVPRDELERYKSEMITADMALAGRALAMQIANGRGQSPGARRLRLRFDELAKRLGNDPKDQLQVYLQATLRDLSSRQMEQQYSTSPHRQPGRVLQRQITRLQRIVMHNRRSSEPIYIIEDEMRVAGRALADEVARAGANSPRARRLRTRIKTLSKESYDFSYLAEGELQSRMSHIATEYVTAKYAPHPDARRLSRLRQQVMRLAQATRSSQKQVFQEAERSYADAEIRQTVHQITRDTVAGRENSDAALQLRRRLDELATRTSYNTRDLLTQQFQEEKARIHNDLLTEKYSLQPDSTRLEDLQAQLGRLEKAAGTRLYDAESLKWQTASVIGRELQQSRDRYVQELRKDKTDATLLRRLEEHMDTLAANPGYIGPTDHYWGASTEQKQLANLKTPLHHPKVVGLRDELDALNAEYEALRKSGDHAKLPQLRKQRGETIDRIDYAVKYYLRLGDPLISIEAPADAQQVIAILPSGEIKRLIFDADLRKWQARFDVPSYAKEGEYSIRIIVVLHDGTRRQMTMRYSVDMTAPGGKGQAAIVNGVSAAMNANTDATHMNSGTASGTEPRLRLEIDTDAGTTRVFALLPWGDKVEMKPSTVDEHRFMANVPLPSTHRTTGNTAHSNVVTYILTDKAHNRTVITVDMTK
ncbi:MAG TPA: VIT domain-containing protein [Abditibacteriaceae bacterium]|jgi:hypothetical protein